MQNCRDVGKNCRRGCEGRQNRLPFSRPAEELTPFQVPYIRANLARSSGLRLLSVAAETLGER